MTDFSSEFAAIVPAPTRSTNCFVGNINVQGKSAKRPSPLSVRLSDAEKADLKRRAGDVAVSAYAKSLLFADGAIFIRRSPRNPSLDHQLLGQMLAQLGRQEFAPDLTELAEAVRLGSLPLDEVTYAQIQQSCADISSMRSSLMEALGCRGM